MKKGLLFLLVMCSCTLHAQILSQSTITANIQILSSKVIKAKYNLKLPKGLYAASVVAENPTTSSIVVGQGSILLALRNQGYPVLSRQDAAAIIVKSQGTGFVGFLHTNLGFIDRLLDDLQGLIVSKALSVSSTAGIIIAGTTSVFDRLTPDIIAQIQQFEATYDADGIQNLAQLGPGQSAVATVIIDSPVMIGVSKPTTFPVNVYVVK
jgi:hypothetical protein